MRCAKWKAPTIRFFYHAKTQQNGKLQIEDVIEVNRELRGMMRCMGNLGGLVGPVGGRGRRDWMLEVVVAVVDAHRALGALVVLIGFVCRYSNCRRKKRRTYDKEFSPVIFIHSDYSSTNLPSMNLQRTLEKLTMIVPSLSSDWKSANDDSRAEVRSESPASGSATPSPRSFFSISGMKS